MNEYIQPPTDNLYKFLAIGGVAFALVAFIFVLREQSRVRATYIHAQVELQAADYVEGSGPPAERELRRAYYRREAAKWENSGLLALAGGMLGWVITTSILIAFVGFLGWWRRVQRYDDAILRASAAKLLREEREAAD